MVPSQLIACERIQKYYKLKIFIIRSDFVSFSYYLIVNLYIYKALSIKWIFNYQINISYWQPQAEE